MTTSCFITTLDIFKVCNPFDTVGIVFFLFKRGKTIFCATRYISDRFLFWLKVLEIAIDKHHGRPFMGIFFSGSWSSVQPPSSPEGEAAQRVDSDWWNNPLAGAGSLHPVIYGGPDAIHFGQNSFAFLVSKRALVPRRRGLKSTFPANRPTLAGCFFFSSPVEGDDVMRLAAIQAGQRSAARLSAPS